MNAVRKLFTPGGKKFYDLFNAISSNLIDMTSLSLEILEINNELREEYLTHFNEMRQKKETQIHRLHIELSKNFITPFDREDIHALISSLDGIADVITNMSRRLCHYNIIDKDAAVKDMFQEIQVFIGILCHTIEQLSNKRELIKLHKQCVEMNRIITSCDHKVDTLLASLYNNNTDMLSIVKYADYYESMEVLFEKCQDAVNALETIIIKYG